jgi:HEAT repeat protein
MAFIKNQNTESVRHEDRQHPRHCPDLLADLEAGNATTRRWAARDLLNCPDVAAALVARLKREDDLSVREVILTTLTRLGNATAVAGLVDCLRSENAALRNEAIEAMKELPDAVAPIMQGLLTDPDPDVRIFAVNILESLRHPDVESWLIKVIAAEPHVNVCSTALDLLSELGTAQALDSLRRLKVRFADEPYIQFAADLALRRIHET